MQYLFTLTVVVIIVGVMGEVPADERQALVDFFNSLDGPNWRRNKWDVRSEDVCTWKGIRCNDDQSHVTDIKLERCGLKGQLPAAALAKLKMLTVFDVAGNKITGPLPSFIELDSLRSLELHHNQFEGTIPDAYSAIVARGGNVILAKNQNPNGKHHFECPYPAWLSTKRPQSDYTHARHMGVPEQCGLSDRDKTPPQVEGDGNDGERGDQDEDSLLQEAIPDRNVRRKKRRRKRDRGRGKRRSRRQRKKKRRSRRHDEL